MIKIILFFLCFWCFPLPSALAHDTTVKVAFLPEMYGFYEMDEYGVYSGYNHDYLMEIAQYTGWDYEYVVIEEGSTAKSMAKAQEMLQDGEIDLLGSIFATNDNLPLFEVGERNYGVARYNLYSLRNNYTYTQDNYFLQDKVRVALFEGNERGNKILYSLVESRDLSYEYLMLDSYEETFGLLMAEEVDCIINLDMSRNSQYLNYLTTVERFPIYFVGQKGNADLMAELDEAIGKLEIVEPDIHQRLLDEYFGLRYEGDFLYTEVERELLANVSALKVGLLRDFPPYQYEDEEGVAQGISVEIIQELSLIFDIPFEIHWLDSVEEVESALSSGAVDMVGSLSLDLELAQRSGLSFTRPYVSSGVYLLRSLNEVDNPTISYHFISDDIPFYPKEEMLPTTDFPSSLKKMDSTGELSIFCDPYLAEYYISKLGLQNVSFQTVHNVQSEISFAVSEKMDENLLGMLNRGILYLNEEKMQEIAYRHLFVPQEYTLLDVLSRYALGVISLVLCLSALVIFYIYKYAKKSQEATLRDGLTQLYHGGHFHHHAQENWGKHQDGALILVNIDHFKEINRSHGHNQGNEVLCHMAKNLPQFFPPDAMMARLGGAEFSVLLSQKMDKAELEGKTQLLMESMEKNPLGVGVTLSIGGYIFKNPEDYRQIYRQTEEALAQVKGQGGNGFVYLRDLDEKKIWDPWSHVLQQNAFVEKISPLLSKDERCHGMISIYLEDYKKKVGHHGEEFEEFLLCTLGDRLKNLVREQDLLGRKGEESFLLFLDSFGEERLLEVRGLQIWEAMTQEVALGSVKVALDVSVGMVIAPEHGKTWGELEENLHQATVKARVQSEKKVVLWRGEEKENG